MSGHLDQALDAAPDVLAEDGARAAAVQSRAVFFLAIAAFAASSTTRVMDAILPQLAREFSVTIGSVAFVATAYAFTYGAFQLVFGPLGDRYGKFRIILIACIGSTVTTFLCAFAGSIAEIAVARFASGMVAAAIVPLSIAWVGDNVPAHERQPVLARFMSGQILGLLAGQIGGGVMGEYFGWRSGFVLIGSVYICAVAGLVSEVIRNPATRGGGSGSRESFWQTWRTFALLTTHPVVRFVLMAVALEAFAMFGAFTYVGAALHLQFGFNFATIGLMLAAYCLGGLFYVTQSRRLIGFFGPARLAFWGAVLVAGAYAALALTAVSWIYPPAIAIMGLGFYMIHNTLQTFATQMAPDSRGSAVAMFATCYFLAQAVGVLLAGKVIDHFGVAPIFAAAALLILALGVFIRTAMPLALDA